MIYGKPQNSSGVLLNPAGKVDGQSRRLSRTASNKENDTQPIKTNKILPKKITVLPSIETELDGTPDELAEDADMLDTHFNKSFRRVTRGEGSKNLGLKYVSHLTSPFSPTSLTCNKDDDAARKLALAAREKLVRETLEREV